MTSPWMPEEAALYNWVPLPELPEGFLWGTSIDGFGNRYINIRNAKEWWIEAGERIKDETIESAAQRCKNKFERIQRDRHPGAGHLAPVYTRRFGVQPQWMMGVK